MIIDKIVKVKKNRNDLYSSSVRVAVLNDRELEKYDIRVDKDIPDYIFTEIIQDIVLPAAYSKILNWLAASDHTEFEARKKLDDNGFPTEVANSVVVKCKDKHYIDDVRYAENYISSHISNKSINEIKYILKNKGIESSISEEMIEERGLTDDFAAKELIEKKIRKKDITDKKEQMKVISYVCSKGFEYETVKRVLNCILEQLYIE